MNIILKIDDETHTGSRILVAKRGTSISAMVKVFLVKETSQSESEADWIKGWLRMSVAPLTLALFVEAIRIHQAYQLSHRDSLIVATALSLNCPVLDSEDMQDGQIIEGLEIINPFP